MSRDVFAALIFRLKARMLKAKKQTRLLGILSTLKALSRFLYILNSKKPRRKTFRVIYSLSANTYQETPHLETSMYVKLKWCAFSNKAACLYVSTFLERKKITLSHQISHFLTRKSTHLCNA